MGEGNSFSLSTRSSKDKSLIFKMCLVTLSVPICRPLRSRVVSVVRCEFPSVLSIRVIAPPHVLPSRLREALASFCDARLHFLCQGKSGNKTTVEVLGFAFRPGPASTLIMPGGGLCREGNQRGAEGAGLSVPLGSVLRSLWKRLDWISVILRAHSGSQSMVSKTVLSLPRSGCHHLLLQAPLSLHLHPHNQVCN